MTKRKKEKTKRKIAAIDDTKWVVKMSIENYARTQIQSMSFNTVVGKA